MTNEIVVSVITISYNDRTRLQGTLDSVLSQTFSAYEYIVVDGKSTDGTLELLEEYELKFRQRGIPFRYLSEKDSGIYDAMNKGTAIANGTWLNYMNAGDVFYNDKVLEQVFSISLFEEYDMLYGKWERQNKKRIWDGPVYLTNREEWKKYRKEGRIKKMPRSKKTFSSHQAMFIKRMRLLEKKYDLQYKIVADFDWCLYAYTTGKKIHFINEYICIFDVNGVSNRKRYATYCECAEIRDKYGFKDLYIVDKIKRMICFLLEKTAQ